MPHDAQVRQPLRGEHEAVALPDTLDLPARARLALHGMGGSIDPDLMTMYGLIHYCAQRPHQSHWASAETLVDPKFGESFPLLRLMSGSDEHLELEAHYRDAMCSRLDSGLYWDRCTPRRPWRNAYGPAYYGQGKPEDFATLPGAGRMLRTLMVWRELGDDRPETEAAIGDLVRGLRRILVCRDDYGYYPEKGGWGEPCAYPRSGWLNTDEARGDVEGCEGAVTCMHGHQLYAAAKWYAQSGDTVALDLATRLANYCLLPRFWGGIPNPAGDRTGIPGHVAPCGSDPAFCAGHEQGHWYSHFHARAIALRGLLEFARATGDARAAEFVRRGYEFTLGQGIARIGWINTYPGALDQMESCALGDLVALGIRLSDMGLGDYWDDVDAAARNQLVEQQLVRADHLERVARQFDKPCWCEAGAHPGQLSYDDVIARTLGVFVGMARPDAAPNPWVMHCCTGNATQGLYYAWESTLRETADTATVNLFLNRAGTLVDVASWLPHEGRVRVTVRRPLRRLALRIPHWAPVAGLRVTLGAQPVAPDRVGRHLVLDRLAPGDEVTLRFPVATSEASYTVNAHTPAERVYTCRFRASTLVDIAPRDAAPTAYPLYERAGLDTPQAPERTTTRFRPQRIVRDW